MNANRKSEFSGPNELEGKDLTPLGEFRVMADKTVENVDFTQEEVASIRAVNDVSATLNANLNYGNLSVRTDRNNGQAKEGKPNEDGFLVGITPDGNDYMVIFDGISSAKGAESCTLAAQVMEEALQDGKSLLEAAHAANESMLKAVKENKNAPMGATMAGILVKGDRAEVVMAGDCQIEVQDTDGRLILETIPQNEPGSAYTHGYIDKKAYWTAIGRNIIREGIGMHNPNYFHKEEYLLEPGMRFTLRSDGDSDNRSSLQVAEINAQASNVEQAVNMQFKSLKAAARTRGKITIEDEDFETGPFSVQVPFKGDNVTLGVYDYEGEPEPEEAEQGPDEHRLKIRASVERALRAK